MTDWINVIEKVTLNEMENELKQTKSAAILLDETFDISTYSQLSTVLHYVTKDHVTKETKFNSFNNASTGFPAKALPNMFWNTLKCGSGKTS